MEKSWYACTTCKCKTYAHHTGVLPWCPTGSPGRCCPWLSRATSCPPTGEQHFELELKFRVLKELQQPQVFVCGELLLLFCLLNRFAVNHKKCHYSFLMDTFLMSAEVNYHLFLKWWSSEVSQTHLRRQSIIYKNVWPCRVGPKSPDRPGSQQIPVVLGLKKLSQLLPVRRKQQLLVERKCVSAGSLRRWLDVGHRG